MFKQNLALNQSFGTDSVSVFSDVLKRLTGISGLRCLSLDAFQKVNI